MKKARPAVHRNGILLAMLFVAFSANAADLTTWQPTTASGGAPVPPGYWDQRATYQFFGTGQGQNNITLAPTQVDSTTTTTVTDYSTNTSNASGGGAQTNYTPITRDNSAMDVTNTTTTNNP